MSQLRDNYQVLQDNNIIVVVTGPEAAASFKSYWSKEALPFIGLPDPLHRVAKLYGQQVKLLKLGRMPAQMLIEKGGTIKFAHYGHSMQDIPQIEDVLAHL